MAASRVNSSSRRIWRRYKVFFYFSLIFLCLQIYIGYSFYSMNQTELHKVKDGWQTDLENRLKHLPDESKDKSVSARVFQFPNIKKREDGEEDHETSTPADSFHPGFGAHKGSYQPKCNITANEALSAIRRATTDQCKQDLADVSCLSSQLKLYPPKLPRFCSLKADYPAGHYLGCFKDSQKERDLAKYNKAFLKDNTPQKCINFCTAGSYKYAGVQYKHECWCGDSFGSHGQLSELACNYSCTGDKSLTCGGFNAQNIYSTGLPLKEVRKSKFVNSTVKALAMEPVRIVFVLTINGRAVRQVQRLIRNLYHKQHYFYIHVDSRQEYLYRELIKLEKIFPNIHLVRERFSTIWGGASLLQAHLTFMKDLLKMTNWAWDYYLNLSESDYPIKTIEMLTAFLTKHQGYNFLKSNGRETPKFIQKQGLDQNFYECDNHLWRLGPRKLQTGIRYDGGSDWICLTRDLCEYSVSQSDDLVTGLKEMYKFTLLPVESFFHTLLQNSAFCTTWSDNNLHLTNWRRKLGCKCQHKKVVDWCGCSPNDFKPYDFNKIMVYESNPTYFARKFEAIVSNDILNQVDKTMHGLQVEDTLSFDRYWQNEFHHLDKRSSRTDLQMTLFHSLVRQMASLFSQAQDTCAFTNINILEVHVLYVADQFHRLLVMYNVTLAPNSGNEITLESEFSFKSYSKILEPRGPTGRLQSMKVGTDFDPKELIFRNYIGLFGVDSEVNLRYVWGPGSPIPISVAWIDPAGVVAAYASVTIPEEGYIDVQKPRLLTPLRPGMWTVKLLNRLKIFAENQFVVLPTATIDSIPVNGVDVIRKNNGPPEGYTPNGDFKSLKDLLKVNNSTRPLALSVINGLMTGGQLDDWIDQLTTKMWTQQDLCQMQPLGSVCPELNMCEESSWSSRYPDPKSELDPPEL